MSSSGNLLIAQIFAAVRSRLKTRDGHEIAGMGYAKSDSGIVASGTEWRSATLAVTGLIEQQHQMMAEMKRLVASRAKVGDALVVLLTM